MGKDDEIDIRIKLKDARSFIADAKAAGAQVTELGNKTGKADGKMRKAGLGAAMFSRGLKVVGRTAKYTGIALVGSLLYGLKQSVGQFKEAEMIGAQTNATIKSTGGIAKVTGKHVGELADTMAMKTGIDDEAIQSSENMLLTFTKIRNEAGKGNDIFDQSSTAVQDLATKMNKGLTPSAEQLQKASIQVGKALNDPVKGVTALRKVGVALSEQQAKQVKTMMAHNDILGAQKVILGELTTEFGGSAEAAGKTFGGSLSRASVIVGNLGEVIGAKLAPYIMRVVNFVTRWILLFTRLRKAGVPTGTALVNSFARVTGHVSLVLKIFRRLTIIARGVKTVFTNLALGLWDIVAAFLPTNKHAKKGGSLLKTLGKAAIEASAKFREFGAWLRKNGEGAKALKVLVTTLVVAFATFKILVWLKNVFMAFRLAVIGVTVAMEANPFILIATAVIALGVALVLAYKRVGWFRNAVNATFGFLQKVVIGAINIIRNHWRLILGILGGPFVALPLLVQRHFGTIVSTIKAMPGQIAGAAKGMWDGIKEAFKDTINWIIEKWNGLEFSVPSVNTHIKGIGHVGGFSLGTPDMPKLATGGIHTGPGMRIVGENGPELGWGGQGATVMPLSPADIPPAVKFSLAEAVASVGGGSGDVIVPVILDGREILRVVAKRAAAEEARA